MNDTERAFASHVERSLLNPQRPKDRPGLVSAAVLVPIVFRNGAPRFIFTLRTMTVAHHKGQISFPGGAAEPDDRGPVDTALRETAEEIGILPEHVRPLGGLDEVTTISDFRVTPVAGLVNSTARFSKNEAEVAEIFELPLSEFSNPARHCVKPFEHNGIVRNVHHYEIEGRLVWGVTGEIIHRFMTLTAPSTGKQRGAV